MGQTGWGLGGTLVTAVSLAESNVSTCSCSKNTDVTEIRPSHPATLPTDGAAERMLGVWPVSEAGRSAWLSLRQTRHLANGDRGELLQPERAAPNPPRAPHPVPPHQEQDAPTCASRRPGRRKEEPDPRGALTLAGNAEGSGSSWRARDAGRCPKLLLSVHLLPPQ